MLRTQTDPSLCALAQVAPRSQTALLSGLGNAAAQATGRPPDDLCHWKGTRHLPDHARNRCRLIKPTPFGSGLTLQNVQTPDAGTTVPAFLAVRSNSVTVMITSSVWAFWRVRPEPK